MQFITRSNYDPEKHFLGKDADYQKLTGAISHAVGHEVLYEGGDGQLIGRDERLKRYHDSIQLLNRELKLGFDDVEMKALSYMYTALSEAPRFQGDWMIEPTKGENTGTHSLHTPLRALKIFKEVQKRDPSIMQDLDFMKTFQTTALALMVHDFGEVAGEAGSLADEMKNKGAKKDKPRAERIAMRFFMHVAAKAAQDDNPDHFFSTLDRVKELAHIQNNITVKDEDMERELKQIMGQPDRKSLNAAMKRFVDQSIELWDMQESKGGDRSRFTRARYKHVSGNLPFIGNMVSACEHAQGTGHLVRHYAGAKTQVKWDGETYEIPVHRLNVGNRLRKNAAYVEGEVGDIFAAARKDNKLEQTAARAMRDEIYGISKEFFLGGPEYLVVMPEAVETDVEKNPEGRVGEIDAASKLFRDWCTATHQDGKKHDPMFYGPILSRDAVVSLYSRAIMQDYETKPGEVLIKSQPEELCGQRPERIGPSQYSVIQRVKQEFGKAGGKKGTNARTRKHRKPIFRHA